jgi:hypothetical protein
MGWNNDLLFGTCVPGFDNRIGVGVTFEFVGGVWPFLYDVHYADAGPQYIIANPISPGGEMVSQNQTKVRLFSGGPLPTEYTATIWNRSKFTIAWNLSGGGFV